ncbi:hypothetical protein ACFLR1_01900 [Bacteroidota bacterium]
MRVVGRIPHPSITITLFSYNERYTVKLEAGPMEQSYKIPTEKVGSVENLQKLVDAPFLTDCLKHFNAMFLSWKEATERNL